MARVKQEKMRLEIDPARPRAETIVYTHYNNDEMRGYSAKEAERFSIKLPQVVADALGITEVRDADQATVRSRFLEAIGKFKNLKTETNRVIVYEIKVEPHPRSSNRPSWQTNLSVDVWAGAFIETVAVSGTGQRRYSYEPAKSSLTYSDEKPFSRAGEKRVSQVPWTERNEAFFKWVEVNMRELINRLAEIEDPVKLLEAIDAGRLLPLGNSYREVKDG